MKTIHVKGGVEMLRALYKYILDLYKAGKAAEYVSYVLNALKDMFF